MLPRGSGIVSVGLAFLACMSSVVVAQTSRPADRIVGMYVHQHWPYKHPYSARTWSVDDWRGYIDGLKTLGYNTLLIWPVLETMPNPLTPSDKAAIERIAAVIDMLHERRMRAYIAVCPNIVADDLLAGQATFEERHFFHCDLRVNPVDRFAVERMMKWREQLLRPLAGMDGMTIIDSDPAGYPNSTNEEFAMLLAEHRKVLDRLRPGIQLDYWMWAGWPAYGRYYATGEFKWGTAEEFADILNRLVKMDLKPWGLACGLQWAENAKLMDRIWSFPYGAIEAEPSLPLTGYGTDTAYNAGADSAPRGVMGNAQTHFAQLANTFAFARGAQGKPVTREDYEEFADKLIVRRGTKIVQAWQQLNRVDPTSMRNVAERLDALQFSEPLDGGPLVGLVFNQPRRLINDLVLQLRYQAAYLDLLNAVNHGNQRRTAITLAEFLTALEAWYGQHGYRNYWDSAVPLLTRLQAPEIDEVLKPIPLAATPFGQVKESYYLKELFTERLLTAIRKVVLQRPVKGPKIVRPLPAFIFKTKGIFFHDGFDADPPSISPANWTLDQWCKQIDWLNSCHINTVEFGTMPDFSRIPSTAAEERRIADRLELLKYARSQGMRTAYRLSNTTVSTVPDGVEITANNRGSKDLCPQVLDNLLKTVAIQKWYMNTFKDVDFFDEFAGDWGGCRCGQCGVADYIRYVKVLADELARVNPKTRLYANTWSISSWGPDITSRGWRAFFDQEVVGSRQVIASLWRLPVNTHIGIPCHNFYRPLAISVYGGREHAPAFPTDGEIQNIRRDGRDPIAWANFILDDDVTRPMAWGLVHSEVRHIRDFIQRLRELGINEVMCNLYLPTLQLSNTYAYGRLLGNPDDDPAAILRGFAELIADPDDVGKLTEVMTWLELNSSWRGQLPSSVYLPTLSCSLDRAQALALASRIRPNPAPTRPLPIPPEEWLSHLARSIERMTWAP